MAAFFFSATSNNPFALQSVIRDIFLPCSPLCLSASSYQFQ